jgi:hypothetical protein
MNRLLDDSVSPVKKLIDEQGQLEVLIFNIALIIQEASTMYYL